MTWAWRWPAAGSKCLPYASESLKPLRSLQKALPGRPRLRQGRHRLLRQASAQGGWGSDLMVAAIPVPPTRPHHSSVERRSRPLARGIRGNNGKVRASGCNLCKLCSPTCYAPHAMRTHDTLTHTHTTKTVHAHVLPAPACTPFSSHMRHLHAACVLTHQTGTTATRVLDVDSPHPLGDTRLRSTSASWYNRPLVPSSLPPSVSVCTC